MRFSMAVAAFACALSLGPVGAEAPAYEMTTYEFVLLSRPDDAVPVDREESVQIETAHVEFLQKLAREKKLLIAGRLPDAGLLREALVLTVDTPDAADAILAEDPWVRQGSLQPEIHTWWAAKDILQPPGDLDDVREAWLGLLKRPEGAPEFSDDELEEIQRGHLANIQAMADDGVLVIAGPMEDDGRLRGILVFRGADLERVRTLVDRDPALRKGRLECELYRWLVPAASF